MSRSVSFNGFLKIHEVMIRLAAWEFMLVIAECLFIGGGGAGVRYNNVRRRQGGERRKFMVQRNSLGEIPRQYNTEENQSQFDIMNKY